jgi:SAM-dependent methyltransferase
MTADVLALLRCPVCGGSLANPEGEPRLLCGRCGRHVPVVDGIPRFVDVLDDEAARRTQESFGYEWTHFNDWSASGPTNFNDYFAGLDLGALQDAVVLDAGCGMGRHARQIAQYARTVVAVDFSRAIDQAARNVAAAPNVVCIQGDLMALPVADGAFDFVYSLGVLHHLRQTEAALAELVRALRPGGRLRIYVYWKRHGWSGGALRVVSALRQLTTRLPFPVLRVGCLALSLALTAAVVLPYRLLSRLGVRRHEAWPLFVYTKYPFNVLYNDQFDRFSAPIEKRYDPGDVRDLLARAGLRDVQVRPCFGWIADATKPA